MIIQELQRRNKWHVLERLHVQYVQEGDTDFRDQYWDLVDRRIPVMRRESLDGSTIQLDYNSKCMCCFDRTGNFRNDLNKHMAEEHLNMSLQSFKHLNNYSCHQCSQKSSNIVNLNDVQNQLDVMHVDNHQDHLLKVLGLSS